MARPRHAQKERLAPFVPLLNLELDSHAYRTLTPSAAKLLPYFKRACIRATKGKPDEKTIFGFTYTEAVKIGFSQHTFRRAMKELVNNGFVDLIEVGGLRGAGHSCSRYRLSTRWVTFGGLEWAQQAHRKTQETH